MLNIQITKSALDEKKVFVEVLKFSGKDIYTSLYATKSLSDEINYRSSSSAKPNCSALFSKSEIKHLDNGTVDFVGTSVLTEDEFA